MIKHKTIEAVRERERERERELQFSKIKKEENEGTKFAFICDRLKDRNRAIASRVSLLETLLSKNKEQLKASLF